MNHKRILIYTAIAGAIVFLVALTAGANRNKANRLVKEIFNISIPPSYELIEQGIRPFGGDYIFRAAWRPARADINELTNLCVWSKGRLPWKFGVSCQLRVGKQTGVFIDPTSDSFEYAGEAFTKSVFESTNNVYLTKCLQLDPEACAQSDFGCSRGAVLIFSPENQTLYFMFWD